MTPTFFAPLSPASRRLFARGLRRACHLRPSPRVRTLTRDRLRKWCLDEELLVPTTRSFAMYASPHDYASHGIYFFGDYDPEMSEAVTHLVRQGQTAWDVGTDRGWFTLLFARLVSASGRVDAFEAFPPNAAMLRRNVEANQMSWVRVHEAAVSDTSGKKWFVPPSDEVTHHVSFLRHCSGVGYLTANEVSGAIEVPTLSLDDHASRLCVSRVDFIKMDIEGAEVAALLGGRSLIRESRPTLVVEYNRETLRRAGTSMRELDALLDSYGYDRFVLRGGYRRVDLQEFDEVRAEEAVFNVYCFPRVPAPSGSR